MSHNLCLCLACFTGYDHQLIHPYCHKWHCFIRFYGWVLLHCVHIYIWEQCTYTYYTLYERAIQPSHPLSSPSPPALNLSQQQGLFQWVSSWHQVARVLELQLQHQSVWCNYILFIHPPSTAFSLPLCLWLLWTVLLWTLGACLFSRVPFCFDVLLITALKSRGFNFPCYWTRPSIK